MANKTTKAALSRCEALYASLRRQFAELLIKFFEFRHSLENNIYTFKSSDFDIKSPRSPRSLNASSESNNRSSIITLNKIHKKLDEILKDLEEISTEYFNGNFGHLMAETKNRISYLNKHSDSIYSSTSFTNVLQPKESSLLLWVFIATSISIFAVFVLLFVHKLKHGKLG